MARALCFFALAACSAPSTTSTPDAPTETWARYAIAAGAHGAHVLDAIPRNPIQGVTDVIGRDYELVLDPSAIYTLAEEPNDQLDWNKLPGFSDCGEIDLSRDGAMFGWRWRPELGVLELAAYANNAGVHLDAGVLATLDAEDLAARVPLRYRVWREPTTYRFELAGEARGRLIAANATLPRRCVDEPLDPLAWAGAFYFGGTSTAPHEITAQIRERVF
ncbi:MAG TPA: hypothetical protein VK427_25365 [Kofleriaceae bacterium]|nr:hypothetical protein [Kofleriaceae bacterium]